MSSVRIPAALGSGQVDARDGAHEETAQFNPVQRLWIVSYRDPAHPHEMLSGGALVVPTQGPVYEIGSLPNPPEIDGTTPATH